jgi:hypothetical protein
MHLLRDSGSVMAGLVPAIHVFNPMSHEKTWMPGTGHDDN